MEGLAAWNATGRVGPIQLPSMTSSNSVAVDVSPDVVTQPAVANTALLNNAPQQAFETPPAIIGGVSTLEAADPVLTLEAADPVSTLEELNAITKVTS